MQKINGAVSRIERVSFLVFESKVLTQIPNASSLMCDFFNVGILLPRHNLMAIVKNMCREKPLKQT